MEKEKMMRSAGTIELILNIVEKIMWLGAVLMIFICAASVFMKDTLLNEIITGISINGISVSPDAIGGTDAAARYILINAGIALIDILISCIGIRAGRNALKTIKAGHPFDESVAAGLKKIGWIILICTILIPVGKAVLDAVLISNLDLSQILNTETAGKMNLKVDISLTSVFFAMVMFLLSHIFHYGAGLEQRSAQQ